MASMLRDVRGGETQVNVDALKSEIRQALINQKANACPIAVRFAWHASGTFDKSDNTGGLDGATIRFPPESTDGANAGLNIIQNLLHDVKKQHPEVSHADLYGIAACAAIEFLGGPAVPFRFGRSDEVDGRKCPGKVLHDTPICSVVLELPLIGAGCITNDVKICCPSLFGSG
jgi:catalase (peroxidase I)